MPVSRRCTFYDLRRWLEKKNLKDSVEKVLDKKDEEIKKPQKKQTEKITGRN